MIATLFSILAAALIQVRHVQVPVVTDRDVPVAEVTVPKGVAPQWQIKATGLPCHALKNAYVKDNQLFVHIDGAKVKDLTKPFRIKVKAKGVGGQGERHPRSIGWPVACVTPEMTA